MEAEYREKKKAILLLGLNGTGKSSICDNAQRELQLPVFRLGEKLRQLVIEYGYDVNSENVNKVASIVKNGLRSNSLGELFDDEIDKLSYHDIVIVDSARESADFIFFKKYFEVIIVGFWASPGERFSRIIRRERGDDLLNYSKFRIKDLFEAQKIGANYAMVDYLITTDGKSIENVYYEFLTIVKAFSGAKSNGRYYFDKECI